MVLEQWLGASVLQSFGFFFKPSRLVPSLFALQLKKLRGHIHKAIESSFYRYCVLSMSK